MSNKPFSIRIFVSDGDPDGVKFIDKMNWTGLGISFPRSKWPEIKSRQEFSRPGIYILSGYSEEDDDLPTIYIGQGEEVRTRIDSHYQGRSAKDFWTRGIAFVSNNEGLNRAHITWLEYSLIKLAMEIKQCSLDNGNTPQEPTLGEAEKADTQIFFNEILQILPLVGFHAFEIRKAVSLPKLLDGPTIASKDVASKIDTIIVPAKEEGFKNVFIGENSWYAIRISGGNLEKIKYIAAYQTSPISAITHYAIVDRIEPYGESGKYKLIFSGKAIPIEHILFSDAPMGTMQSPRYTSLEKLKTAKKLSDLF